MMYQVQSDFIKYMREYLYDHDFTEIHTPKFIGAASESGSEVFEVKYFDGKAYLAQSPQFYKQMAIAAGFGNVFEVAPCFRAENSNTSRHATEFTSFDLEFSYIDSFHDVMNLEAEMLTYALKKLDKTHINLDRVNDIITELSTRLGPLQEQKEKASIYMENKEGLDKYELALTTYDIDNLNYLLKNSKEKKESIRHYKIIHNRSD